MKKREYTIVEEKYLAEFISKEFPKATKVMYQVPCSDKPWKLAARRKDVTPEWFYRFGPRIDAVVINNGTLWLIEAETRRPVNGLSELELYAANYKNSLLLRPYAYLPLGVMLVSPILDEYVAAIMKAKGWVYKVYHPPWITEHLKRWGIIE
jgi:hypothetical protein